MEDFKVLNRGDISINMGGSGQWGTPANLFKYRITKGPKLTFYFLPWDGGKDVKLCSIYLDLIQFKSFKDGEGELLRKLQQLCSHGYAVKFPFLSIDPEHEDVVWIGASCIGRILRSEGFLK